MGDCETPLQLAADAVLQRNALIVTTLDGAARRLLVPTDARAELLARSHRRLRRRLGQAARRRTAQRG